MTRSSDLQLKVNALTEAQKHYALSFIVGYCGVTFEGFHDGAITDEENAKANYALRR